VKRLWTATLLVALTWSLSSAAQVTLDRYTPTPHLRDGFVLPRPDTPGHLAFGAQLVLNYANEPLAWETRLGDPDSARFYPVEHQLTGHVVAGLSVADRVLFFVDLPVNLLMRGDRAQTGIGTDSANVGNFRMGARLRILGDPDDRFALGLQGSLSLPSSHWADSSSRFSGERKVSGQGMLLGEIRGARWRVSTAMGARFRNSRYQDALKLGSELLAAVGAGVTVLPGDTSLDVLLEFYGTTVLRDFGDRESSPFESLLGLKMNHVSGVGAGLAGSLGLSHGYGSPTYRLVALLGWQMAANRDRDKDGIEDKSDRCPEQPEDRDGFEDGDGCPDPDNDGDGILDKADQCPTEREDSDGFEDADGCPESDNDKDGLLDDLDRCPLEPEDLDGFQDTDGCPDPDNDGDGVLDTQDKCPSEVEDRDGFNDDDGCPDPDNDGDGILDAKDACPLEPESLDGRDDDDGCPDKIRVDRALKQIMILEPVLFAKNSATILPPSFEMLREIARTLTANSDIKMVRIEGHTDDQGKDEKNQALSEARAISVLEFMVTEGVEANRLTAKGFGESVPIADNKTAAGRTKNRRVEFRIE